MFLKLDQDELRLVYRICVCFTSLVVMSVVAVCLCIMILHTPPPPIADFQDLLTCTEREPCATTLSNKKTSWIYVYKAGNVFLLVTPYVKQKVTPSDARYLFEKSRFRVSIVRIQINRPPPLHEKIILGFRNLFADA